MENGRLDPLEPLQLSPPPQPRCGGLSSLSARCSFVTKLMQSELQARRRWGGGADRLESPLDMHEAAHTCGICCSSSRFCCSCAYANHPDRKHVSNAAMRQRLMQKNSCACAPQGQRQRWTERGTDRQRRPGWLAQAMAELRLRLRL